MVSINGCAITLTHGDSLTLTVGLKRNGQTYTPVSTDIIRFALSRGFKGEYGYEVLLEKQIPYDTLQFTLTSVDTAKLDNATYNYDIEIKYEDGNVDTFISSTITITGEVK